MGFLKDLFGSTPKSITTLSDNAIWNWPLGDSGYRHLVFSESSNFGNFKEEFDLDIDLVKTPEFDEFQKVFLSEYDNTFGATYTSEPPSWDELTLPIYPNYGMSSDGHPFRVREKWDNSHRYNDENKDRDNKAFGAFLFYDINTVGELQFAKLVNEKLTFVPIFRLKVDLGDILHAKLWLLTSTNPNIKTALFSDFYFKRHGKKFERVSFRIPRADSRYRDWMIKSGLVSE